MDEYVWVRRWGEYLGWRKEYIDQQVEVARREAAPPDAVYRMDAGGWATTSDIVNLKAREALGLETDHV